MRQNTFEWIGENLALDFVNTASWTENGAGNDRLGSYRDLIAWGREARLPTRAVVDVPDPSEASRATDLARRIREILHEIFSSGAEARAPDKKRLAQFNAALSAAFDRLEVASAAGGFSWAWVFPGDELEGPLWPVLWAAALLMTGPEAGRIRRCADPKCGLLYLDRSRRGNRRWCSMKECGNRAKARRHYARLREAGIGLR